MKSSHFPSIYEPLLQHSQLDQIPISSDAAIPTLYICVSFNQNLYALLISQLRHGIFLKTTTISQYFMI